MTRKLDPVLRDRIVGKAPDAWKALRAWLAEFPPEEEMAAVLAEAEAALADWPAANRSADAGEWAMIAAGGRPPLWWPLVQAVTIDEFAELEPVWALQSVRVLRFGQRARTRRLTALSGLPHLRELALGGLGDEGLLATPPLPNLARLSVAAESLPDDFFRRFQGLSSLSLANSSRLERLPPLPSGLVELDLAGCASLGSIDAVASCANLRCLGIQGCDRLENLTPLAGLTLLERVDMDARRKRSLQPLASCKNLRELWIGEGETRVDLVPLLNHPGLRVLGLEGCRRVEGIAALTLPALEEFHLLRCAAAALPDLGKCPHLRVLDLEGLHDLAGLPPLAPGVDLALLRLVDLPALPASAPRPAAGRTVEVGLPQ